MAHPPIARLTKASLRSCALSIRCVPYWHKQLWKLCTSCSISAAARAFCLIGPFFPLCGARPRTEAARLARARRSYLEMKRLSCLCFRPSACGEEVSYTHTGRSNRHTSERKLAVCCSCIAAAHLLRDVAGLHTVTRRASSFMIQTSMQHRYTYWLLLLLPQVCCGCFAAGRLNSRCLRRWQRLAIRAT